ncbi:MAG: protein MobC [Desulfovibrio sp.]|nr:protein MobC [Desulfovibrio sp.]
MTVKQTIMALAPTLERMKKRGFELSEIVSRLHEKGIEVKPQTLAKYLAEARRQKEVRKAKRQTASPHCSAPQTACRNAGPQAADTPPKQPVSLSATFQGAHQKTLDLDDEDWIGKVDYSNRSQFKIKPDTPIDEL